MAKLTNTRQFTFNPDAWGSKRRFKVGNNRTLEAREKINGDLFLVGCLHGNPVVMARNLGLLSSQFSKPDEDLSAGSATKRPAEEPAEEPKSQTGNAAFDATVDGLNASLDAGVIDHSEAQEYEHVNAELAMQKLSVDDAVETVDLLADGTIAENDVPSEVRQMLKQFESKVEKAATASAQKELGPETFNWLSNAASAHPGVQKAVRQFAVDRAAGRAGDISWSDFADHIRDEMGG